MEILLNWQKLNWRAIWWEPNFWVEHQHWSRRVARTVWKNWDSGSCVNQELVWVKRIIQKFKFRKSLSLTSFLNGNRVTLISLISPTGVIPTPAEPALLTYSGAEERLEDLRKCQLKTMWKSYGMAKHTLLQTDQIKPGQGGCVQGWSGVSRKSPITKRPMLKLGWQVNAANHFIYQTFFKSQLE